MSKNKKYRNLWISTLYGTIVKRIGCQHLNQSWGGPEVWIRVKEMHDGHKHWMYKEDFDREYIRVTKDNHEAVKLIYD